ncbi:MAG: hypothetical protein JWR89_2715 [Tardiphaga sp.]|uniref:hypothetical protein n=1 Tax=Tardiphaga sp. TaxID=1926292 RepID=UPI00260CC45D|nr:hypothetical protein [Tardiphaga sp.]MDB5502813.1 hypothetical protein [Tardiphaga sp.]
MSVERSRAVRPGLRVYARQDSDQRPRAPLCAPASAAKTEPDDEHSRRVAADAHLLDVTV